MMDHHVQRRPYLCQLLVLLFIMAVGAAGQSRLQISGIVDHPVIVGSDELELYRYWKWGMGGEVSVMIPVSGSLSVQPGAGYQYRLFNGFEQTLFAGSHSVASQGDGVHILSVDCDLVLSGDRTKGSSPFLRAGIGYAAEGEGNMTITWRNDGDPMEKTYSAPYIVAANRYWYCSADAGWEYAVTNDLRASLSAGYSLRPGGPTETHSYRSLVSLQIEFAYFVFDL